MSEISDIYKQYEESLRNSREEYDRGLKEWASVLKRLYDEYLHRFVCTFMSAFKKQIGRIKAKEIATSFFGREELPFIAIDGSCYKEEHEGFMSFYGGAYGSRGDVTFEADSAKLRYRRWEFSDDVSVVAFLPLPPDQLENSVELVERGEARFRSDAEIRELSSLHSKIMQLAEVYLTYSQVASGGVGYPRIVLMDTTLSGLLGNTSYSPRSVHLTGKDFEGESLSNFDLYVALAHPFNVELGVPGRQINQPWNRVFSTAHEKRSKEVSKDESGLPTEAFERAKKWLEERELAEPAPSGSITLTRNPRSAWRSCLNVFKAVCERLFRDKNYTALSYEDKDGRRRYMSPADVTFLTGVGFRRLIELCWRKKVLLVGVVKDSSSRYFYRNFLGSATVTGKINSDDYLPVPLTDRMIAELLPHVVSDIEAPWSTTEFDSAFMTLHPENGAVRGYIIPGVGRVTRPERIFLRSLAQFFLKRDRGIHSHVLFIDRLAYPHWDDEESEEYTIDAGRVGELSPLYFEASDPQSLQYMTQFLLSVLVKNHFPEALGYPDPLHKADWGAKSMGRCAKRLVKSGGESMKSKPLEKTFREIRESFGR